MVSHLLSAMNHDSLFPCLKSKAKACPPSPLAQALPAISLAGQPDLPAMLAAGKRQAGRWAGAIYKP